MFLRAIFILLLSTITTVGGEGCPSERAALVGCLAAILINEFTYCLTCINNTVWDNAPNFIGNCSGLEQKTCSDAGICMEQCDAQCADYKHDYINCKGLIAADCPINCGDGVQTGNNGSTLAKDTSSATTVSVISVVSLLIITSSSLMIALS